MSAILEMCEEEELGYEFDARSLESLGNDRRRVKTIRELSGRERASQQSRYSRRPSPSRQSGTHRRGNKRHGI